MPSPRTIESSGQEKGREPPPADAAERQHCDQHGLTTEEKEDL